MVRYCKIKELSPGAVFVRFGYTQRTGMQERNCSHIFPWIPNSIQHRGIDSSPNGWGLFFSLSPQAEISSSPTLLFIALSRGWLSGRAVSSCNRTHLSLFETILNPVACGGYNPALHHCSRSLVGVALVREMKWASINLCPYEQKDFFSIFLSGAIIKGREGKKSFSTNPT